MVRRGDRGRRSDPRKSMRSTKGLPSLRRPRKSTGGKLFIAAVMNSEKGEGVGWFSPAVVGAIKGFH